MLSGREEKKIWKYIAIFMIMLAAATLIAEGIRTGIQLAWIISSAEAEDEEYAELYVTADVLNGRAWPSKKSKIEAVFDYGDRLKPTGRWKGEWIEVEGGESGTGWVHYKYVSERILPFEVVNENNGKVKIRSKPGKSGKIKGYVKRGKTVEIDQVVLGWGHCSRGWVDLKYFSEGE